MPENYNEDNKIAEVETDQPHVFSGLVKGQKIALAVLAFFALIVLVYGASSLRAGIYGPFQLKTAAKSNTAANIDVGEKYNDLSDEQLKNKDTDKDGLSDYDELNSYKTSPYLEDSDSDGFLDKEEIDNNKDPNCPIGRECSANVLLNKEADLTNPGAANNIDLAELDAINKSKFEDAGSTTGGILPAEMDAATLRQMLIDAGMEKALLDQISDKNLMATFQESLAESGGQ